MTNERTNQQVRNMAADIEEDEATWKEKALRAVDILRKVSSPPLQYATVIHFDEENDTVDVALDNGTTHIVQYNPQLRDQLREGARVQLIPDTMAVISLSDQQGGKNALVVKDVLADGRIRAVVHGDDRVLTVADLSVKVGDTVLTDPSYSLVLENLGGSSKANRLEVVPTTPWSSIGGLERTIEQIRDSIETPFIHRELFSKYPNKRPPRGVMLYGPPGCGKTLLGKAVAYNLAARMSEQSGKKLDGHFLYVAGPEFLQKYVGTGEERIRELFGSAREVAKENGEPVVMFIDEAEGVMRKRGTGISTDATDSLVEQFNAEMDGMDPLGNVIVLLASNRQDIIDPAILRPGRVDRKIYVPRPNQAGAEQIFRIYLKDQPLAPEKKIFRGAARSEDLTSDFARHAAAAVFTEDMPMVHLFYADGTRDTMHYRHIFSGASVVSVVDRASERALKRAIGGGDYRLTRGDLSAGVKDEYLENRGLPNLVTRDDIRQAAGEKADKIIDIRPAGNFNGSVGGV